MLRNLTMDFRREKNGHLSVAKAAKDIRRL
jgi:hypothetical protein